MSKGLKRKTIFLVILEILGLIVMGIFMMRMQTNLSLDSYRKEMVEELDSLSVLLADASAEEQQSIETDNAIYQSKAASIAFMAANDAGYEETNAKMREYAELLGVDNVLIVDKEGNQLARAKATEADFTYSRYNQLRTVFSTGEPSEPVEVELDDFWSRFYSAKIDNNTMAVVEKNPEELYQLLEDTTSQSSILGSVSVGLNGYIFSISGRSYEILYHPNETMIGKDALSGGISASALEDGAFSWITLNNRRYYAGVTLKNNVYYVAVIPESEIEGARNVTVGVILFIFFAVMTIVITYGVMVMRDYEKKGDQSLSYVKMGRIGYNKVLGSKAATLSLVGLLCILVITYYMQTLFALSNQSMSNNQRVEDVENTILRYEDRAQELTEQYNDWYLSKCQAAAYTIEQNRELENKEALAQLADVLQIANIYVFDENGTVTATNSNYNKFTVSQDPEDQSYEFNKLLLGGDYVIQEPQPDEVSGDLYQYIGVSTHDEEGNVNGFVQIAIRPERLEHILENMQISNVLDGVQIGGAGFAFAVDKESGTFVYYPEERLIGRNAVDYGMKENQLKDGYSDYFTIQSTRYYGSSVDTGTYYVYVAVPEEDIMTARIPLTLACGVISLVSMVLIFLVLSLDSYRDALVVEGDEKKSGDKKDKRMIDVTLPDGRVKKTESAASRWMFLGMSWDEKTPEQQIATVVKILFGILAVAVCVLVLFQDRLLGEGSIFGYVISGKWEKGLNIFALTASVLIICVAGTATALIKRLLQMLSRTFGARGETVCRMIGSFVKYVSIIAMAYYCFALFGVDTATLLASAGLLTLAVSLGAKELISDILSGLFIIFEGEFRVGDIVMIGDWRGTVLEIGVRTTKVEDGSQNIKIIRNSNVSGVINMTKHKSYASCDVGIEYGESLERVEAIFQEEFPNIRAHLPAIQDGPFYKGVVSLGDNSVNVRIVVQCNEGDRAQLERDLNREMKLIFDKHNINIPFPQVVVNQPIEFEKATDQQKLSAKLFAEEQRETAKDIGNEEEEDN